MANRAQGPAGNHGANLRNRLAKENRRLPILGNTDETANYQYVKQFLLEEEKALGRQFGLEYAEGYHYIGPKLTAGGYTPTMNEYIEKNAVPLR